MAAQAARVLQRQVSSRALVTTRAFDGLGRAESDQWSEYERHTMCYPFMMKHFSWNAEKNEALRRERGVSFEEVVFHIERGDVLDILEHPNREKYPSQRVFIVNMDDYAFIVPFIESAETVFLKTIIPSRKATRKYLGDS